MLWQEYIPYIFSILIWPKTFTMMLGFGNNQNIHYWESKSVSKIMCSQKYGDLYILSYLLPTLIFCMYMQLPFYKFWFPPYLKTTLVGNILPHIFSFFKTFWKQLSYDLRQLFKTSSCHNWVWSFYYKMILLNYGNGGVINSCGLNCVVLIVIIGIACVLFIVVCFIVGLLAKYK